LTGNRKKLSPFALSVQRARFTRRCARARARNAHDARLRVTPEHALLRGFLRVRRKQHTGCEHACHAFVYVLQRMQNTATKTCNTSKTPDARVNPLHSAAYAPILN
jgi:hypothetical protein